MLYTEKLGVFVGWGLVLGWVCLVSAAWGGTDAGAEKTSPPEESSQARLHPVDAAPPEEGPPVYKPPARGKPRGRVAGGVRGVEAELPSLQVLVPEHAGQTLSDQPSLFWYVDGPPPESARVFFTLIDEASVEPLVEVELERPARAGIYRIDLAEHAVHLERGAEYEWSVVLVVDSGQRSKDVVSSGWIDRVEAPAGLAPAGAPHTARAYAECGLWYDALGAASDGVRADPANAALRGERDSLLRQVGLPPVGTGPGN
jgi:hypothetical protein